MKLYELHQKFAHLEELMDSAENPDVIRDTLDSIDALAEEKALNIVWLLKQLEGEVELFKAEEMRLAARRRARENRIHSLKEYLMFCIEQSGRDKLTAGTFMISKQRSNASVAVDNVDAIPLEYMYIKTTPAIDRAAILDALKNGVAVPGARLLDQEHHIRIR